MAFTFVAAGTASNGNNATSLTPGLPSGWAAGDLHILQVQTFGGTNGRVPQTPSGWTELGSWANGTSRHLLAYRIAVTGDTAPTVTMSGTGATSDTQLSRIHGFRTDDAAARIVLDQTGATSTNASADNIGPITGITVGGSNYLSIISAGKSNDFNGNGSLTNYTQAALTESTTGNDAGMTLMYRLATPSGATGNLTVTDNGATASNGVGQGQMASFYEAPPDDITVEVREGATLIATRTITPTTAWANYTVVLDSGELASITDFDALRIELTKVRARGGLQVSEIDALIAGIESAGGGSFTQSLAASLTPTTALGRRVLIQLAASATPSTTLVRKTARALAASVTGTTTLGLRTRRSVSASLTPSSTLSPVARFNQALAASLTATTTLGRTTRRALAASITATTTLVQKVARTVAASVTPSTTLDRRSRLTLGASVTGTTAIGTVAAFTQSLAASLTPTTTLGRRIFVSLAASVTASTTLGRRVARALAASVTPMTTLAGVAKFTQALSAAITMTTTVGRRTRLTLAAVVTATTTLSRRIRRALAASLTATTSLSGSLVVAIVQGYVHAVLTFVAQIASTLTHRSQVDATLTDTAETTADLTKVSEIDATLTHHTDDD